MTPAFLDHFRNPRNVGTLPAADAAAAAENPVCGDRIQLAATLREGVVTELRYRVQGCSGAIAAASAMSELVSGRSLEEARALDREGIEAALGGLPPLKRHGADLAADGLQRLLASVGATGETP